MQVWEALRPSRLWAAVKSYARAQASLLLEAADARLTAWLRRVTPYIRHAVVRVRETSHSGRYRGHVIHYTYLPHVDLALVEWDSSPSYDSEWSVYLACATYVLTYVLVLQETFVVPVIYVVYYMVSACLALALTPTTFSCGLRS
jgi:hypothetical protein